ncbi:MAG TPA: protein kinase [Gemmatimonadales bacterium]|nr:protein kinase [Gemmatimonadales bacterium]
MTGPMADPREQLQRGLAGRYEIERELGRGGMATVYLARDLRHDRPVALKVLLPELAASLGPERFQREIRMAARLQHPHVLTVLDSGEADAGLLWFTMPYIEGESLRDRLNREQQLPVETALRIAREAADALDYAHRHGVIHRDIKPENILLSEGHALVADFGIARALDASAERLTNTGLTMGTPAYMSPEQAAADKNLDARTDIYSLGIVLFEMLAGETPFAAPTAQAMIARRFTEAPRPLGQLRETVPDALGHVVAKALARQPADRYATAADFARALDAAGGTAEPAPPIKTVSTTAATREQASRPGRRRAPLTLALGIGFLLGLGVLFGWLRARGPADAGGGEAAGPKLLAVLPFENLGDSADAYFADGITDEVRGKLATLSGLQVIASTSAGQYKHTTKPPQEIAKELGVSYLLLGKIRWEKQPGGQSRVRVSPELVQVAPGGAATTRWQRAFDASLTDVFQVQADIASRVAQALNVALEDRTQQQLAEKPTRNLTAYDAYLKGVEAMGQGDPSKLREAVDHFERAVALDTAFAPAWARLSGAASLLLALRAPQAPLATRSLYAANRALALAPDRPEGHLALGDYYRRIERDFPRALQAYAAGQNQAAPNAELLRGQALAEEALGRFEAASGHYRQAYTLDPRSPATANAYAANLRYLRRYAEAREIGARAVALAPTNPRSLQGRVMTMLADGDLAGARAVLKSPPAGMDLTAVVAYLAAFNELYWALTRDQQDLVLRLPPSAFDDDRGAWALSLAGIYWLRGDTARVRTYGDSARIAMLEQVRDAPDDGQLHVLLGSALAYAGRNADAVREGLRGVELEPISKDANLGAYALHQLVRIYILVGEQEKAIDALEKLLSVPYDVSPGWLRIDPTFDPLRQNPRFRKLVEDHGRDA